MGGETNQYYPALYHDNHTVAAEKTPEEGYHLTEDLVDKAINFIADAKQVAPQKPFFLYFCPGAGHAPHQVPKVWADHYKGKFDAGWDKLREAILARQKALGVAPADATLSRHDPDVPPWDQLSADEKQLYARMMEVFAGFITHTHHHIGRLLDFLKALGELDNTIIMLISDNGASSEGGPQGMVNEALFFNNVPSTLAENLAAIDKLGSPEFCNHYAWGWTWAGNTPFKRWKRETYRGGVSDPFIVHWPQGITAKGEVRTQYAHAIDMVPTILEAAGYEPPEAIRGVTQSPIQGVSFAHSFNDATAETRHLTQYFEMMGHRAIYHDGWRAVCPWPGPSFKEAGAFFGAPLNHDKLTEIDATTWELYHVAADFAENDNIAAQNRPKLIEMITTWYVEAGKYNVLPIDSRGTQRFADERPKLAADRARFTLYQHTQAVPTDAIPSLMNRSYSITADVDIPKAGAEGVLLSQGGNDGGYAFFVQGGKLHYAYNYVGRTIYDIVSSDTVPSGAHQLRYEFEVKGKPDIANGKGAPGQGRLYIDGKLVGQGEIALTMPLTIGLSGGVACGAHLGAPVTPKFTPPFAFTGTIRGVTVDVGGDLTRDRETEMRMALARQ